MKNIINLNTTQFASQKLSQLSEQDKNIFLQNLCQSIYKRKKQILVANSKDVKNAIASKVTTAFIQRLTLDHIGIEEMIKRINRLQSLNSKIGETIVEKYLGNGIRLKKIRVPIGTILIIYEARPEVTIDTTTLCIKSGNVAILKGGIDAINTNIVLYKCITEALICSSLPKSAVNLIASSDRNTIYSLLNKSDKIDLVIARGSYQMVKSIQKKSRIPVLAHSSGGARIYIDKSAKISLIKNIIINSKKSKPSACNSLNTLIIHRSLAPKILPLISLWLREENIQIIKNNWTTEFLDLRLSIKIVNNLDAALKFINLYSHKHSEAIIARDRGVINKFIANIDAAAVFVNCSTRFHDGYEFGMGAEMGIATGKLHARGPVGLEELSIYKWIAYGKGQIRV